MILYRNRNPSLVTDQKPPIAFVFMYKYIIGTIIHKAITTITR